MQDEGNVEDQGAVPCIAEPRGGDPTGILGALWCNGRMTSERCACISHIAAAWARVGDARPLFRAGAFA